MNPEPLDFSEVLAARRESAAATLRDASYEELKKLIADLLDVTHPWAETATAFIEQNRAERAVRGETSDGVSFVYYPGPDRGLWFQTREGNRSIGMLSNKSRATLAAIVKER
jgi:hypothetical protein